MPREAEKIDFEIIHHLPNQLGECPVWDDRENLLYWVDIKARQILRHDPSSEKTDSVDVPGRPGMLALCEDGGLVIAQERGLQRFSFEEEFQEFLVQVFLPCEVLMVRLQLAAIPWLFYHHIPRSFLCIDGQHQIMICKYMQLSQSP